MVGSWTNPVRHDFYANGNALVWSELLPYRQGSSLPDNFGTTWASGCYGDEMVGHVWGACQIYEHSGNKTFLNMSYAFYKELFWAEGLGGLFGLGVDSALCLNKMAGWLGMPGDAAHWNASVNMAGLNRSLHDQWEKDTPNMFGSTNPMSWTNIAPAAIDAFPREWLVAMAENWLDNPQGFFGDVPLARIAVKDWAAHDPDPFAIVPDANWYMIRTLFKHNVNKYANKFTLAHLAKYNMEAKWGGIPVAPEGRLKDNALFGDQFSNFNAGKILLFLEGLGGLSYSAVDDQFTFADSLPAEWDFLEFQVPVGIVGGGGGAWVKARAERQCQAGKVVKTITVDGNPFKTRNVRPWTEDATVTGSSPAGASMNQTVGHADWRVQDDGLTAVLKLDVSC